MYSLLPEDLFCPPPILLPEKTQEQVLLPSTVLEVQELEGSSLGASFKLFVCRTKLLALMTVITLEFISRCLLTSQNLQNISSTKCAVPRQKFCQLPERLSSYGGLCKPWTYSGRSPTKVPWSVSVLTYPSISINTDDTDDKTFTFCFSSAVIILNFHCVFKTFF